MKKDHKGHTLIELVAVIAVAGILSAGVAGTVLAVVDLWSFVSFRNDEAVMGKMAIDWMTREIRTLRGNDAADIQVADTDEFDFFDGDDVNIVFELSGSELQRNSDPLCRNVTNLLFTYFDENNAALATPVGDVTDIWRVGVSITVASGNESITYNSIIFPRNLRP
ncbi:MAG: prepilin-type N-terminal cleavage/methylation domain-containing protein [Candidatus Omnitrophica bacterium]|nr:prepilin-type N-terminal cleavage/methylation domain-containing protein [Candidatus Omnitrophota bacterium]